jgi:PBSX family phage terminase large subunit
VTYLPLAGKQAQAYHLTTGRSNIYEGAVRSSKTISTIVHWLNRVRTGPKGAMLMVGKTERTLKRNIIDPIQEMVGTRRCKFKIGAGEIDLLGRTIYIAGAHDESSADKIKGMTLADAYGDEVTTWPESFYKMLMTRLSIPGSQFVGTTNPAAPTHWLMKGYLKRASLWIDRHGQIHYNDDEDALNLHRFTFQLADNPHLTPEYVADLSKEFVGLFYRRYVLGEWVLAEGAIFDMWNERKHVRQRAPRMERPIAIGIDYGTRNPFHAVRVDLGVDGRLWVTDEYRYDSQAKRKQLTDAQYADALIEWMGEDRPAYIVVDPSAASFRTELLTRGIATAPGNNEVLNGIRTVSKLLARDQLRVVDFCTGLLDEIPGYSWDDDAADKGLDEPMKQDDHGVDALRYALHTTEPLWRNRVRKEEPAHADAR